MTQTQPAVDVGAAVLKDVDRHKSFKSDALIEGVTEDFVAYKGGRSCPKT